MELLESKTKDLPTFEARAIKRRLAEATAPEIERKFNKVLESVKKEAKKVEDQMETTLESEIDQIVDSDDIQENDACKDVKENDILKNRNHNAHVPVVEKDDRFETMEEVRYDENGEVELDDSDVIDPETMKHWCAQAAWQ